MQHRYDQLHLSTALCRSFDYPQACKELACLLRGAYSKAPKAIQLLMYQDVLTAFRLLAGMDTIQQLSAVNLLLQAVEATFPKQRRAIAVSEYKQAAVSQHRRTKHQDSKSCEFVQLSTDLLVHIFGFLDARSLATASAVCRGWNEASNDNVLWRAQFLLLFGGFHTEVSKLVELTPGSRELARNRQIAAKQSEGQGCWRRAFELARQGRPSRIFSTNRAYCMECKTLVWLSEPPRPQDNVKNCNHGHRARAMLPAQVLTYFLRKTASSSSSSSSDTDSEEELSAERRRLSRLWAY